MGMTDLPMLSGNVVQLMRMLKDPGVPVSKVIDAINKDQSLVAQILKLVNSGYYNVRSKVNTLDHAVALVGFVKIWELLMSTSVMNIISGKEQNIWLHSYTSSVLLREIIEEEKIQCSAKIQLTMLMHDIGKIVLSNFNSKAYRKANEESIENAIPQYKLEIKHIGVHHAEVGGWLLQAWELEDEQIIPISLHHSEKEEIEANVSDWIKETALLRIVDYIDCKARGFAVDPPCDWLVKAAELDGLDLEKWYMHQQETLASLEETAKENMVASSQ